VSIKRTASFANINHDRVLWMQSVESKEITKIIMEFVATITSLKIYPHPQVIFLIDRLFDSISRSGSSPGDFSY